MGYLHIICSSFALVFGTLVLFMRKGTRSHKRIGYLYVACMIGLLLSSFMIYGLYHRFGPFHVASVISTIVLGLGMIPILTKRPLESWKFMHFNYMYWSVIGLYMALIAELLTRIPGTPFYGMVVAAMIMVTLLGFYFFNRNKARWKKVIGLK